MDPGCVESVGIVSPLTIRLYAVISPLGRSGTIHVTLRAVVLTMDNTGAGIPSGAVENKVQQVSTHTNTHTHTHTHTHTSKGDNCNKKQGRQLYKNARDTIENKGDCYNKLTVKVKYEMKCEMKCTHLTGQPQQKCELSVHNTPKNRPTV